MTRTSRTRAGPVGAGMALGWLLVVPLLSATADGGGSPLIGDPLVTWYAGRPALTDASAELMRAGGWNVVWASEQELDVAQRHGLRAMLKDGLLTPATLDNPDQRAQLDALVARVRTHPALHSYYLIDEPSASAFPAWGRLVAYLRERDPAHLAYLNLFPTYANNDQLGTPGDTVAAYREHLRQFVDVVRPDLLSYDHYHFQAGGDGDQYFLNLAMIRRAALDAGIPFLNIVQGCTWTPAMRVPHGRELRFLGYTTLAYGGQGLSYFVYSIYLEDAPSDRRFEPAADGGMVQADGTPTPLYYAARRLNHEFVAIARELRPLRSLGAYHAGVVPWGAEALPADSAFRLDPPVAAGATPGLLLGCFGKSPSPTHVVVVNLDYRNPVSTSVVGPGPVEVFDATWGRWLPTGGARAELTLRPGGGKLLRVAPR